LRVAHPYKIFPSFVVTAYPSASESTLNWDADGDHFSDGYELHLDAEPLNALSTQALPPVEH
jgi:hypothetical protein